jgi:CHASE2 domain-containing sensor protein
VIFACARSMLTLYSVLCRQRGTSELKKYLRSRIEQPAVEQPPQPATVFQETVGTSGVIGGGGDFVDRHKLMATKSLDYWSAYLVSHCVLVGFFSMMMHAKLFVMLCFLNDA